MTHPTDDELEAHALSLNEVARDLRRKNLDAQANLLDRTAAMLRACKSDRPEDQGKASEIEVQSNAHEWEPDAAKEYYSTQDLPPKFDPMPRQDIKMPPPAGYVPRADYDALSAALEAANLAARYESDIAEQALQEMRIQKARVAELEGQLQSMSILAMEVAVDATANLGEAQAALYECMDEIDGYIKNEYPGDHPVHERYRNRDFSANPARIYFEARKPTT